MYSNSRIVILENTSAKNKTLLKGNSRQQVKPDKCSKHWGCAKVRKCTQLYNEQGQSEQTF